jgi:hypothetical protein
MYFNLWALWVRCRQLRMTATGTKLGLQPTTTSQAELSNLRAGIAQTQTKPAGGSQKPNASCNLKRSRLTRIGFQTLELSADAHGAMTP